VRPPAGDEGKGVREKGLAIHHLDGVGLLAVPAADPRGGLYPGVKWPWQEADDENGMTVRHRPVIFSDGFYLVFSRARARAPVGIEVIESPPVT
jgi:hypothetical protein